MTMTCAAGEACDGQACKTVESGICRNPARNRGLSKLNMTRITREDIGRWSAFRPSAEIGIGAILDRYVPTVDIPLQRNSDRFRRLMPLSSHLKETGHGTPSRRHSGR
jgi:hypothetical protein